MEITRRTANEIEATVSSLELEGIKNCLNDVWGALRLPNFEAVIGASEDAVSALIDPMVDVLSAHFYGQIETDDEGTSLYLRRTINKR